MKVDDKFAQFPLPKATFLPVGKFDQFCRIRKIRHKGPSCFVICIDLLVAGDVNDFATFAKLILFAKFTIFVKFAILDTCKGGPLVLIFALTCWLLAKLAKLSKSAARQCKALLAILTTSPTSSLRAFLDISGMGKEAS